MPDSLSYCLLLSSPSLFPFCLPCLWKSNYLSLFYLLVHLISFSPNSHPPSSFPFFGRPDFSFQVDSQPGSCLSPLELKFLDCWQLSTFLLIARVAHYSFYSAFSYPSVTSCFSIIWSFLYFTSSLMNFTLPGHPLTCLFLSQTAFHITSPYSFPVMFFIDLCLAVISRHPSIFFTSLFWLCCYSCVALIHT